MVRRLLAFGLLAAALIPSLECKAAIIFNSFDGLDQVTNSFTTTGSTPRNFMADDFSTLALSNPNFDWQINSIGIRLFVVGSGIAGTNQVYNNVSANVRVFNSFNGAAGADTSVFSDLASNVTWNLGNITNNSATGGAQAITFTLPYLTSGLAFRLDDGQSVGISVEILENGIANQNLALLLRSTAGNPGLPSVGTSANGWYRDADNDGIIEASDRRTLTGTNSNVHFLIDATAVPEPASFALLGLGTLGFGGIRRIRTLRARK